MSTQKATAELPEQLIPRLKRAEGQLRGVQRMLADGDIVTVGGTHLRFEAS